MSERDEIDFNAVAPPGYVCEPGVEYWAERATFERLSAMSLEERFALAVEFQRSAHELHIAGLALAHPGATRDELELRAAEIRLGKETVAALLAAGVTPPWVSS